MLKRMILIKLTVLGVALLNVAAGQAQTLTKPDRGDGRRSRSIRISSYKDDPFVRESIVERMDLSRFDEGDDGRFILRSARVEVLDEAVIYRQDRNTLEYKPFAWTPWPETRSTPQGDFRFTDEERFPLFRVERGPDGKIILKDGLQLWTPQDLNLGMTTTYEAAYAVKDATESWAGRAIIWGVDNGRLQINAHSFTDFNAFYSPTARQLFFGVVAYRPPGQTEVKMFETATSWEMVAHECGHAVHHTLKPNIDLSDPGYRAWSESFGDQTAMWTSLRNRDRAHQLLAETNGDLNQSNALTRMGEAFAALSGKGTGMRDAFHEKKVSDTSSEVHDRSEVLTGAAYKLFLAVYSQLKNEQGGEEQGALSNAGEIMGAFLTLSVDFTPENKTTLEDVAKAYLKVDKEFFDGRYHNVLVEEFTRRELLDADSVDEWLAHEAATPYLCISRRPSNEEVDALIQANLDTLGIGPDFGLKLQSVSMENPFERGVSFGQTVVRVQLTQGRGDDATPLDNHGILVFSRDGALADYHAPMPLTQQASLAPEGSSQVKAMAMIGRAKQLGLDQRGAPISIVRQPDGRLTVEARVVRGAGLNTYMEVFTLDNPRGERREIVMSPIPPDKRIPIPDDLNN